MNKKGGLVFAILLLLVTLPFVPIQCSVHEGGASPYVMKTFYTNLFMYAMECEIHMCVVDTHFSLMYSLMFLMSLIAIVLSIIVLLGIFLPTEDEKEMEK